MRRMKQVQQRLKEGAEAGDTDVLYSTIEQYPYVLERIDEIPFVDNPLHTAAAAGNFDFAIELMRLKPSFGRKLNPKGLSPLHLAVRHSSVETAKRLIKLDKDLVRVQGRRGLTPLHYAAETDDADLLAEFLCACPASVDDLTAAGETAVLIAVKNSSVRAFKVLLGWLRKTGNTSKVLDGMDEDGNTPLHIAVSTSQPQIVKLLVKCFAKNKNDQNLQRLTALDIALSLNPTDGVGRQKKYEIVNTLRRARASKSSSLTPSEYTGLADFLMSPKRLFHANFRYLYYAGGEEALMKNHEAALVVAVLIVTATYQSVLSPPGVILPQDCNNNTASATTIPSSNGYGTNYTTVTLVNFSGFYLLNTLAFAMSMTSILFVLNAQTNNLLRLSLTCLTVCYSVSLSLAFNHKGKVLSNIYFVSLQGCWIAGLFKRHWLDRKRRNHQRWLLKHIGY